jgi:hypothetical protein
VKETRRRRGKPLSLFDKRNAEEAQFFSPKLYEQAQDITKQKKKKTQERTRRYLFKMRIYDTPVVIHYTTPLIWLRRALLESPIRNE